MKGKGGGVKNWTAQPNIFPDGARYLSEHTGWKFQVSISFFMLLALGCRCFADY